MSLRVLTRLPLARLRRTPRGLVPVIGWSLLAVLGALLARVLGASSGADHILRGTFGPIVMPLLTYAIVSATFGGSGLRPALRGLAALGAPRGQAALASVVVAMGVSALACAFVAGAACVIAHGEADPPLVRDLPATLGIGLVGGAAYAAFFGAGSAFGRGAMRGVFLGIDFIIGAPAGFGSIFTPRAHVVSLLGGPACFELSRRVSSVILVVLLFAYLGLAVRLGRRAS